ncbi:hypothetical protein JI664_23100 [Rhodobacter sp. NTK016B]|uniref:hypothetical protein n=1 Tax=Rhodobacter sp. NTK016B TaxID=2759676 RepID=UPI001A909F3E|nr:hypothetical protein [Rhodobacter sp. NTK016B]MBN8294877.1 hypothetical protein [Rhodobacter sp. NTK016B]
MINVLLLKKLSRRHRGGVVAAGLKTARAKRRQAHRRRACNKAGQRANHAGVRDKNSVEVLNFGNLSRKLYVRSKSGLGLRTGLWPLGTACNGIPIDFSAAAGYEDAKSPEE